MKEVHDLDAKLNYRRDIWMDRDGSIWYFDFDSRDWRILTLVLGDNIVVLDSESGYANDLSVEMEDWPDAPFTRLVKGVRE